MHIPHISTALEGTFLSRVLLSDTLLPASLERLVAEWADGG
jgi:hypothetical protein